MVKLIVQIPCFNEADTLPAVAASIPRQIPGVDCVEVLVVDDGSSDSTAQVARAAEVDHIVRHSRNRGLAAAFQSGIEACLSLGADIIVNTDGDNQYPQTDIPRLIRPILDQQADVVVADRQTGRVAHFSPMKKLLQALGSWTVRLFSGTQVADAPSGFRAYSREAAEQVIVLSTYSYTLETLIQAGRNRLRITNVPVEINQVARPSRLMRSIGGYVWNSSTTIFRAFAMYEPMQTFTIVGLAPILVGLAFVLRFAYYYAIGDGDRFVQSLTLAAALLVIGFLTWALGVLADLIAANRRLEEQILLRLRRLEARGMGAEAHSEAKGLGARGGVNATVRSLENAVLGSGSDEAPVAPRAEP